MFSLERIKKGKLDTYKKLLIEHWGILIFVPAILGGILQIFKLASMDLSFVRFFAVEQVVPDGLLIIFTITIGFLFYKGFDQYGFELKNIQLGWSFKNICRSSLSYIVSIIIILLIYSIGIDDDKTLFLMVVKISLEIAVIFFIFYLYITICFLSYFRGKFDFKDISNKEKDDFVDKIFFKNRYIGRIIIVLITIFFLFYFLVKLIDVYGEINKIKNIENELIFLNKVKNQLRVKGDLSIEYFNGKYIFLKIKATEKSNKYLILKGEGFVNLLSEK